MKTATAFFGNNTPQMDAWHPQFKNNVKITITYLMFAEEFINILALHFDSPRIVFKESQPSSIRVKFNVVKNIR